MGKTGFKHSEEAKEKMRKNSPKYWLGKKRLPFTEEHRKKIGISSSGRKMSEKNKKILLEINRGKTFVMSDETKRKISDTLKGMVFSKEHLDNLRKTHKRGKDHIFWKGGVSFTEYTVNWTNTLRQSIRERDKYICQMCGKNQDNEALSVHHIDYNKQNCNPDNLISLCRSCHNKTSLHNRDKWIKYFYDKDILNRKLQSL